MADIIKIAIKGSSEFCSIYEAFKDKITLTEKSVSYDYIPRIETEINPKRNWTYKTNSPIFKFKYDTLLKLMKEVIERDFLEVTTDVGTIEFIVTYSDNTKYKNIFQTTADSFSSLFRVIKSMVPGCEYTPAVLLTEEDFEEE